MSASRAAATLRAGSVRVRVDAPADLLATVLGPLAALVEDDGAAVVRAAGRAPSPVEGDAPVLVRAEADEGAVPAGRPTGRADDVTWDAADAARPAVLARGLGRAEVPGDGGPVLVRVRPGAPATDAVAEGLVVPALAERLRREGVLLVHAAVLAREGPAPRRAWLVPASRGGGKTTFALSLRGRGFALLSDDRGFLLGAPEAARVDPWPEAPRVGDRSLFLLPPRVAAGPRDPRTGKAPVPGLTPPRLRAPLEVAGVLVPRLVDGPGGALAPLSGAAALAEVVPHAVVATDPATARTSLAWVAAFLAARPVLRADVGDDPERLAAAAREAADRA